MAAQVLRDAVVTIGGLDLANYARSVTINYTNELLESTGFGDTARTYVKGFAEWNCSIDFWEDLSDNGLSENIYTWAVAGDPVAITIRASSGAISATNPEYQGNVLFTSVPLFSAQVGAIAGGTLNLQGSGTLTRDVTP